MTVSVEVTTRPARCTCGREAPIGTPTSTLAFFETRGPGTTNDVCKHCKYKLVAHERKIAGPHDRSNNLICDRFEPLTDGYPFDLFYCGHGGWD